MVCQDQIQQIIMLTNLSEKGEVLYLEMKKNYIKILIDQILQLKGQSHNHIYLIFLKLK